MQPPRAQVFLQMVAPVGIFRDGGNGVGAKGKPHTVRREQGGILFQQGVFRLRQDFFKFFLAERIQLHADGEAPL